MKDSLKSTPELGRENEKPRSLAENTFHDIAKYLPADETYLTLNSREDGIEGFYMRYDKEEVISGVTK